MRANPRTREPTTQIRHIIALTLRLCIACRPDYWRKLVRPANPKFNTLSKASGINPLQMQPVTGTKAQSDFFKFSTRLTVPSDDVGV